MTVNLTVKVKPEAGGSLDEVKTAVAAAVNGWFTGQRLGQSVLLAQLYMEGAITFGSLFAGLTAGAGVGLAVLWRVNPSWKQNLFMTGLLWAVGAAAGMVLQLIF